MIMLPFTECFLWARAVEGGQTITLYTWGHQISHSMRYDHFHFTEKKFYGLSKITLLISAGVGICTVWSKTVVLLHTKFFENPIPLREVYGDQGLTFRGAKLCDTGDKIITIFTTAEEQVNSFNGVSISLWPNLMPLTEKVPFMFRGKDIITCAGHKVTQGYKQRDSITATHLEWLGHSL